jgi:hypothetical protein
MHQIYPDEGLIEFLERAVAGDFKFKLFTNNFTPDRDTELADLTEAVFAGYAEVTVAAADFTLSGVAGHVGSLVAAPIAFLNSSGISQNAYGYYATDSAETMLLMVARFDSAPVAKATGDSFLVTPTISDFSQYAS